MIMLRSTHMLLMEIQRMNSKLDVDRALRAESIVKRAEAVIVQLKKVIAEQRKTIAQQVSTNSELTRDLLVVRGAARVRQEKIEPGQEPIHADVILQDETRQGLDKDQEAVQDAQRELDRMLKELSGEGYDPASVTEEALAAATPNSKEEWEEEHASPA